MQRGMTLLINTEFYSIIIQSFLLGIKGSAANAINLTKAVWNSYGKRDKKWREQMKQTEASIEKITNCSRLLCNS